MFFINLWKSKSKVKSLHKFYHEVKRTNGLVNQGSAGSILSPDLITKIIKEVNWSEPFHAFCNISNIRVEQYQQLG